MSGGSEGNKIPLADQKQTQPENILRQPLGLTTLVVTRMRMRPKQLQVPKHDGTTFQQSYPRGYVFGQIPRRESGARVSFGFWGRLDIMQETSRSVSVYPEQSKTQNQVKNLSSNIQHKLPYTNWQAQNPHQSPTRTSGIHNCPTRNTVPR